MTKKKKKDLTVEELKARLKEAYETLEKLDIEMYNEIIELVNQSKAKIKQVESNKKSVSPA
jgi:hypothetical protein